MSVGYTCPGLNEKYTECSIHWSVPRDGLKCRVQGDHRPKSYNTTSQKGQAPAGQANIHNKGT